MKSFNNSALIGLFIFILPIFTSAQSQDTTLVVNGACGMCKKVIEKAAKLEGVTKAKWNEETKILQLSYNAEKVSLNAINKAVAASGYDTEYLAAPDSAYQALHGCCHYRDPEVVQNHQKKSGKKK